MQQTVYKFGEKVGSKVNPVYQNNIMTKLKEFQINQDARFHVYGLVKHVFGYEKYIDKNKFLQQI